MGIRRRKNKEEERKKKKKTVSKRQHEPPIRVAFVEERQDRKVTSPAKYMLFLENGTICHTYVYSTSNYQNISLAITKKISCGSFLRYQAASTSVDCWCTQPKILIFVSVFKKGIEI